jgi:hypothetical protein
MSTTPTMSTPPTFAAFVPVTWIVRLVLADDVYVNIGPFSSKDEAAAWLEAMPEDDEVEWQYVEAMAPAHAPERRAELLVGRCLRTPIPQRHTGSTHPGEHHAHRHPAQLDDRPRGRLRDDRRGDPHPRPHINWDAAEDRYAIHAFVSAIVSAFCREHRDTDWGDTDLDYAVTLDTFTLEYVRANQPAWLRDF